ncbi:MAG TPA: NIPSNAP family protein [Cyclobacteriaceae bacterium]|nr:NIPSNAP family protein [Cyclobacteriaceae bacterium]
MERRDFIQKSILTTAAMTGVGVTSVNAQGNSKNKEVYEFRVYRMRRNLNALDNYFSKALIPALNKAGVKNVGVFRETGLKEPATIYMLIPYASFEDLAKVTRALKDDKDFAQASSEYSSIPADQAIYERFDSSILLAFDGFAKMVVPPKTKRLFELRIYEGYSEDAVRRKVKMFNEGEIDIFKDVNLPAVFYSENITGVDLPCLTYMAAYESMEERDRVWKAFFVHPDWQRMSKLPEYANTVSKVRRMFLEPMSSSQV